MSNSITLNIKNGIAEGDETQTPLQFVYDAADCRIWWTAEMLFDVTAIWRKVADVAFGVNGSAPFADGCVAGSTNQNTSLSGDSALEGNGQPANVTVRPGMAGLGPSPTTAVGVGTTSAISTSGAIAIGEWGAGALALVVVVGLGSLIVG
jgi:hypothetical protein